jgi:hypothetical protein
MSELRIEEWREMRRGSLVGFATVGHPSGMVLHDCGIFTGPQGARAAPPSKPTIGRDGLVAKDAAGKARYVPTVSFVDKTARDRWSAAVIAALRVAHPTALGGSE